MELQKNEMKVLITFFFLMFSIAHTSAQQVLEGLWNTGKEETLVEISYLNEQLIGKIKSSNNEHAKIGKTILKDLRNEGGKWLGKIYAVKRRDWYSVKIVPHKEKLELTIATGLFSKTLEWKREN